MITWGNSGYIYLLLCGEVNMFLISQRIKFSQFYS